MILEADGATRSFRVGGRFAGPKRLLQAVRGVSLSVRENETVALVGESGSGKSTLARMLLGLLPPSSGTVRLHGRPIQEYSRAERARLVQPVFQDPYASLNPLKRIGDIIAMPLRTPNRAARVAAIMHQVGLDPALAPRTPAQLSGGQRQRVAIARALVAEPPLIVCDEPTSALDVSVQAQILKLLQDLRAARRMSMLLVTHNLAIVQHLADQVAVMYLGRIVEQGPGAAVLHHPRHPYTGLLLSAVLTPDSIGVIPDVPLDAVVPNPLDPPSGCAFHPRCPRMSAICEHTDPPQTAEGGRSFACHHPLESCEERRTCDSTKPSNRILL